MTIKFNVPGKRRKELAQTIGTWLGCEVSYKGAPTFAYEVDYFTIDRDGNLVFDDRADSEVIEPLIEHLYDASFEFEAAETAKTKPETAEERTRPTEEPAGLTITVPLSMVAAGNLTNLLDAKGDLIKKALGIPATPIVIAEDTISFPWFAALPTDEETALPTDEEITAYSKFIDALCAMSKNQKRISATEKPVDNEKYAFRCFLLRLGFIGDDYKKERKILLRRLSGNSAFKGGACHAVSE